MKSFIFSLILIILKFIQIINIIVLPFEIRIKPKKNIEDENEYYIYSNISMGEPSQNVNCEINFDISDYFMTYYPINVQPTFNYSLSKTFKKISMNWISSSSFSRGFWANDNFYFYTDLEYKNKQKIISMEIVFPSKENKLTACEIGLQSLNSLGKLKSLIHILKSKKIINNYIFKLKFINLNKGSIIIGSAPHEYDNINYNENELKFINTLSENDKLYWCLYFKYNPLNNFTLSKNIKVRIYPKILGLIATYYYLTVIEEIFFKKYYENKLCEKKIVSFENTNYFKIICFKDDFNLYDIEKFPSLHLYNIPFNYTFILDGKDLFTEDEEKFEFQILIEIGSSKIEWKLGRIFLLKYQIIFEDDNNLIGFYIPKSKKDIYSDNKKGKVILKVIILLFTLHVFIFVSFLLYKKINILARRKKMANELEDDFMYIAKSNPKKVIN